MRIEKIPNVILLFLHFISYDPVLTYGEPKARAPPPLVPAFVALEKKVRCFSYKIIRVSIFAVGGQSVK